MKPAAGMSSSFIQELHMLSWAIGFLIIAIIAAFFGFGGIAAGAVGIAKVLFFLFLVAFVVALVMHLRGGGPRVPPAV
jgi:uncharacterized membrane protein YtjA (UPF0391 family)